MKCPSCGYEHEGHWSSDGYISNIGDEKFIDIYTAHKFEIDNPKEFSYSDYNYHSKIEVGLIACPKCNTVILDRNY